MVFFGKRRQGNRVPPDPEPEILATADGRPESVEDWRDPQAVRAEWVNELRGAEAGLLGWRNGTHMCEEGGFPTQRFNAAEYLTRGLAHHLFTPILSDE